MSVWRDLQALVGAQLALRRAERRMEGRCPPHRVKPPMLFCLDCGKYPEQRRGEAVETEDERGEAAA